MDAGAITPVHVFTVSRGPGLTITHDGNGQLGVVTRADSGRRAVDVGVLVGKILLHLMVDQSVLTYFYFAAI